MNDNNTNNNTNANNAHGDLSLDELLTHSLLGETTPEQEEVVATALADDPQLRAEFEARKESIAMLQGAQQQTPALSAERRAELLQETQPAAPPTPWRVALSWAAALVLVGVAAILLGIFDDAGRGEDPQGVGGFIEMAAVAPGEEVHGTAASVEVPQPTNPPVTRDAPAKAEYAPSERREVASPPAAEFSAFSTARAPMPDATIVANEEVLLLETTQLSGGAAGASGNKNPYPNAKYRRMFRKPEILSRNTKSTPKRKPLATATLPVPRPGPVTDGYLADYSLAGDAGDLMGSESRGRRRAGRMGYLRHDVDRVLEWIRPRPTETPSAMFFRYWGDNAFVDPAKDPQSTFGVDVDTASYTLTRKYLQSGHVPPKSAIRTEEFVNYFKSGYPAPTETDLAIHVE
ncbi:MAG: von Willebrand factor type A domain-containing protein, partial [Planctomycetota bacterium]